ncbi:MULTISPECIES: phosphotransferase family protein [Streptomyces]|uniref:phosphotransferase family protein n=1 Tax=Streptomyces TaxID=1883 RepID=UPI000A49B55A|nr:MULTISPECIES: aminoglycoside phosphotransferase family protein [Streptomyces]
MAIGAWPDRGGEVRNAVLSEISKSRYRLEISTRAPMSLPEAGGSLQPRTCPVGKPVDPITIRALTRLLAQLMLVRKEALPPLPAEWPPNERDSRAYLDTVVRRATQRILGSGGTDFSGLFAVLGVPGDALAGFAGRMPSPARRPYGFLLMNLNRDNAIVLEGPKLSMARLDWRSASYGDPLHGLASHVVRMRYPEHQLDEVLDAWVRDMGSVRLTAVNGARRDFSRYVTFERINVAYAEVITAAESLGDEVALPRLAAAAEDVRAALEAASDVLGMSEVPPVREIADALFRWQSGRIAHRKKQLPIPLFRWVRDTRVTDREDFPYGLVRQALALEGVAPAHRVFRGTAHLNTVVHLDAYAKPVVVRRETAAAPRREQGELKEHAVLQVIEKSSRRFRAPRILALGYDDRGRHFAIHTYEGPSNRAPSHPEDGLLPGEADELVDALATLAMMDYSTLPFETTKETFYARLSERLAAFVDDLPIETRQAARTWGLPDGSVLRQILRRYQVTERTAALLHGDLNPWNLIRDGRRGGLTIIDWEMGMIGDPLYDLVRHLHLTPTRPEMRTRMFKRWSGALPPEYVAGWEQDWRVYRWIEQVRSAYVDLDRITTGAALDTPNVRRAVDAYEMTLTAATGSLGLRMRKRVVPKLPAPLKAS